jgi:Glycosyltransferase family 87
MRIVGAYALVAVILAVAFAAGILLGGFRAIERSDYLTYHVAARIVLDGDGACLYDVECQSRVQQALIGEEPSFEGGTLPYNSPPWFAALVAPFGLLSLQLGFVLFTLIGLAVLGLGTWRVASWDSAISATRLLAVVLVLTAWPTVMGAIRGQLTLAVAGLLAISVAGSGIALGLATMKPTLVPVWGAWLVAHARWRALGVAAAVFGALVVLSLMVVSPQALLDYPAHLFGVAAPDARGVHVEEMVNWRGVAERLGLGDWFVIVATVATLVAVAAAWWRNRSLAVGAAIAFLATPLVIPHANQHEAILAELGVVLAIAGMPGVRRPLVAAAIVTHALLWTGPVLQAFSGEASAWLVFACIAGWFAVVAWLAVTAESVDLAPPKPMDPLPSGHNG